MDKKTALITGASSGIGKETAKALIKQDYVVYVAARRIEKMDDLKELGCHPIKMDITNEEDVRNAVSLVKEQHGGVDVLVNNAGFGMYGSVEETTIEDARYQFDVNLFGLAHLTKEVLPYMRDMGAGKIINVTSVGGKIHTPLGSWYHATKHALEGWSDCLRIEVEPFGIDVIIIEPGAITTEFGDVMSGPMLERSGNGVYAKMAKSLASANEKFNEQGSGSHPSVIAETISKSVNTSKPKTRYAAGKLARPLLFIRKWSSDRTFDRLITSMIR